MNENPKNYFAEVEQAAFSPANTVPSMQPSADPVLQSRLFSYTDTQRHRLGTNYVQIPVNSPLHGTVYAPNVRDGAMNVNGNLGATPNYLASDIPVEFKQASLQEDQEVWEGAATPFHWKATPYEWEQPAQFWKVLARYPNQQEHLAHNIAVHVANAKHEIQDRVFKYFGGVSPELEALIKKEVFELSPRK